MRFGTSAALKPASRLWKLPKDNFYLFIIFHCICKNTSNYADDFGLREGLNHEMTQATLRKI